MTSDGPQLRDERKSRRRCRKCVVHEYVGNVANLNRSCWVTCAVRSTRRDLAMHVSPFSHLFFHSLSVKTAALEVRAKFVAALARASLLTS